MTSITNSPVAAMKALRAQSKVGTLTGHWVLQDAKARFSELVRRVHSDGPQRVTVHGRDEVVVISAKEFNRLKGATSGQALIEVLQLAPYKDEMFENISVKARVREVRL
jgi:prevent-host-death family protein